MMNSFDKQIGEIIKNKRNEMKMSQTEFANKIGLTKMKVHYYESGKRSVSLQTFYRICNELDMNPNDIFKEIR